MHNAARISNKSFNGKTIRGRGAHQSCRRMRGPGEISARTRGGRTPPPRPPAPSKAAPRVREGARGGDGGGAVQRAAPARRYHDRLSRAERRECYMGPKPVLLLLHLHLLAGGGGAERPRRLLYYESFAAGNALPGPFRPLPPPPAVYEYLSRPRHRQRPAFVTPPPQKVYVVIAAPLERPLTPPPPPPSPDPNALTQILRQLQAADALPRTLTPANVDNSIRTLVRILEALRRRQKAKPAKDDSTGGTPGRPGVDYPTHRAIPPTGFRCSQQRYKGFFGDPAAGCQAWHYCDLNGGQASFLCPNGTVFSQVALTCDWWYNVECGPATAQQYVLNERLYKYILPLAPKFPEDYSGPLVDKYLTGKFREMEEQMRRQRAKGKGGHDSEETETQTTPLDDGEDAAESSTAEEP